MNNLDLCNAFNFSIVVKIGTALYVTLKKIMFCLLIMLINDI